MHELDSAELCILAGRILSQGITDLRLIGQPITHWTN